MNIILGILVNIITIIIGYLFGSINWAIIFSWRFKKDDIRNHGSNNAGSTNALRTYGIKLALPIFILDIFKSFIVVVIASVVSKANTSPLHKDGLEYIIPQFAALGAIIGHIWPVYFKFKGGKGAACILGAFFGFNLVMVLIGVVLFLTIVIISKYVSLGSIVAPLLMIFLGFIPWFSNGPLGWFNWEYENYQYFWVNPLVILVSHFFVIGSHHQNIRKLIQRKESKLKVKK